MDISVYFLQKYLKNCTKFKLLTEIMTTFLGTFAFFSFQLWLYTYTVTCMVIGENDER